MTVHTRLESSSQNPVWLSSSLANTAASSGPKGYLLETGSDANNNILDFSGGREGSEQSVRGKVEAYLIEEKLDGQLDSLCKEFQDISEAGLDDEFVSHLRHLVLGILQTKFVPFAVEMIDETWITVTFGVDSADRVELSLNPRETQVDLHICNSGKLSDYRFELQENPPSSVAGMINILHARFLSLPE